MREQLDEEATLADTISPGSDFVEIGNERKHVISYLEDFLFAPERARSPVKSLSGGERNRLLLARLFARPANVLVLDEPTNDLDIETLELLEALLQDYAGTVFLVSHDRAFLDNVVTQTIASEGQGKWKEYIGGYSDWLQQRATVAGADALATKKTNPGKQAAAENSPTTANPLPKKNSLKNRRAIDQLMGKIAQLETQQAALHAQLAEPDFYQQDVAQQKKLHQTLADVEAAINTALAEWETLEDKA
jgi:ATP-binding cassette subfamily F protein uup